MRHPERASWLARLSSGTLDYGCAFLGCSALNAYGLEGPCAAIVAISLYYLFTEVACGSTIGKWLLGFRLVDRRNARPNRAARCWRLILRLLLGPAAVLSWRRATLLDLLTGLRSSNGLTRRIPLDRSAIESRCQR